VPKALCLAVFISRCDCAVLLGLSTSRLLDASETDAAMPPQFPILRKRNVKSDRVRLKASGPCSPWSGRLAQSQDAVLTKRALDVTVITASRVQRHRTVPTKLPPPRVPCASEERISPSHFGNVPPSAANLFARFLKVWVSEHQRAVLHYFVLTHRPRVSSTASLSEYSSPTY
jgi:hypothetical protein